MVKQLVLHLLWQAFISHSKQSALRLDSVVSAKNFTIRKLDCQVKSFHQSGIGII